MGKYRAYEAEGIRVLFDARRCIHAGECVRGLPKVFNPQAKPWIQSDGATPDEIADVVSRCPTGALIYERLDGAEAEAVDATNTVAIAPDGPLYVRGKVQVLDKERNLLVEGHRLALCRCGASTNKPLCDGKHVADEFEGASSIPDPKIRQVDTDDDVLRVIVADNGPLIFEGPVEIFDTAGEDRCEGSKTALCRCGASDNKPFCDGTHSRIEFTA